MSSAMQHKLNQSQGGTDHAQADKTEEWIQSTKDSANAREDRPCAGTQTAQNEWNQQQQRIQTPIAEWNQYGKDENHGFLQQTGEQVVNMAQGAVDTVKNKFGMGNDK